MCGKTHDQGLACTDLMVTNASTVLQYHPDGIFLRSVNIGDALLFLQGFQVQVWEGLVTAVVIGTYKAIEFPVVHVGHRFLPLGRMTLNPFVESFTDGINLAGGQLHLLMVGPHDGVTIRTIADHLIDDGGGVIQGMTQEVKTSKILALALNGIFTGDLVNPIFITLDDKFIKVRCIFHLNFGAEKFRRELREIRCRHPTLTKIKVQFLERDRTWTYTLQCLVGTSYLFLSSSKNFLTVIVFKIIHFLHDVAGQEPLGNLITTYHRIIIDLLAQTLPQFILGQVTEVGHIRQIHIACPVQRGHQRFLGGFHMGHFIDRKRYRLLKDVGFHVFAIHRTLNTQHIPTTRIHQNCFHALALVQGTEPTHKFVIRRIQICTSLSIFFLVLGFRPIQVLIGITHFHVLTQTVFGVTRQGQGLEHPISVNLRQSSNLPCILNDDTIPIIHQYIPCKRTRLHPVFLRTFLARSCLWLFVPQVEQTHLQAADLSLFLTGRLTRRRKGRRGHYLLTLTHGQIFRYRNTFTLCRDRFLFYNSYNRRVLLIQVMLEIMLHEETHTRTECLTQFFHRAVPLADSGSLSVRVSSPADFSQIGRFTIPEEL